MLKLGNGWFRFLLEAVSTFHVARLLLSFPLVEVTYMQQVSLLFPRFSVYLVFWGRFFLVCLFVFLTNHAAGFWLLFLSFQLLPRPWFPFTHTVDIFSSCFAIPVEHTTSPSLGEVPVHPRRLTVWLAPCIHFRPTLPLLAYPACSRCCLVGVAMALCSQKEASHAASCVLFTEGR